MSLTRSLIPQQHRPILDQLLVRLSLRQGQVFARNLRRSRHAKGLSQEALAHEASVDRTYISSLERGVYAATIDMVGKLAEVLGVEPDELLRRGARTAGRVKR
jgi:transcriptional regulator with XRE-family HTH domain